MGATVQENHPNLWAHLLPQPTAESHKYTRGMVSVLTGPQQTGAGILGSLAARRVGAGLVRIGCHPQTHAIYGVANVGAVLRILETPEDHTDFLTAQHNQCFLIGPGLPPTTETADYVRYVCRQNVPVILDGGALSCFQDTPGLLTQVTHPQVILTPHAGEFPRLFGAFTNALQAAQAAAEKASCHVVLKGAHTVVAAPDGQTIAQQATSHWLATAGTGDVLAGLIAGLVAQRVPPLEAAACSVWLHNMAAERAGAYLLAEDLLTHLQACLQQLF